MPFYFKLVLILFNILYKIIKKYKMEFLYIFYYYYMMSANWVSVQIMEPSEYRPTGFLPTARPPAIFTAIKLSNNQYKTKCKIKSK